MLDRTKTNADFAQKIFFFECLDEKHFNLFTHFPPLPFQCKQNAAKRTVKTTQGWKGMGPGWVVGIPPTQP